MGWKEIEQKYSGVFFSKLCDIATRTGKKESTYAHPVRYIELPYLHDIDLFRPVHDAQCE